MRKKIFFTLSIFIVFICFILPLQANHLDGLWRSDRSQITLRIEQDQDGFKAKRTDQGIWYHYTTDDHQHFTDRYGNWYELAGDDELIWNEANSSKRMYFTRVEDRDGDQWDNHGNNYDPYFDTAQHKYGNAYNDRWNDELYIDRKSSIEGNWYDRNGRDDIQIISFAGGIRVKSHNDGWDKFYADRTGNRFRDRYGNTIIMIDRENLRYRSQYGRQEKLFTRHRNWNHGGNSWRD